MNTLVEDGLGLMVLGMGFVFVFLLILIVATNLMSSLLNSFFPETAVAPAATKMAPAAGVAVDAQMTAVITAAIHQHRAKNQ